MWTRTTSRDWITEHRAFWSRKPALRAVYERWFSVLRAASVPGTSIVELGCGPGFLKVAWPEVVATDVEPSPYTDRVVDAAAMPFDDGEVGNLVLVDVFHHLPKPAEFLREAARTLRPRGRIILLEPWTGLTGRFFYRWIHHEGCDLSVPVGSPWGDGAKDPMEGNAALPYLYFRPGGHLEQLGLPLRIVRRERFAALPWILSGGFQPLSLLPRRLVAAAEAVDRVVSRLPAITATRCLIVVERAKLHDGANVARS